MVRKSLVHLAVLATLIQWAAPSLHAHVSSLHDDVTVAAASDALAADETAICPTCALGSHAHPGAAEPAEVAAAPLLLRPAPAMPALLPSGARVLAHAPRAPPASS